MKAYLNILFSILAVLLATACHKDDDNTELQDDDPGYDVIPYSITVGITPMSDQIDGVELKTTFAAGDIIEISNPRLLVEPAILTSDDCVGKDKARFSGELKVRLGSQLVAGSTKLTAALKNADPDKHLYNDGKQFMDVKQIESFAEGLDKYSYWACENYTYNPEASSIDIEQKTVFAELFHFAKGTTVEMSIDRSFGNESIMQNTTLYAMPYGLTCFGVTLDEKGKYFYRIEGVPENCLPGVFSVGYGKRVRFSRGNLQYRLSDGQWRFAPFQYNTCFDRYGRNQVGVDYSELDASMWIDLFGFGTWLESGNPKSTSVDTLDYPCQIDDRGNLVGTCAVGSEWDILTYPEWYYLLYKRPDSDKKIGYANIDEKFFGIVLLPDDWVTPQGLNFEARNWNKYSTAEWLLMESNGAIFLPSTGIREGDWVFWADRGDEDPDLYYTTYWTKTIQNACNILFGDYWDFVLGDSYFGHPVRLVSRLEDLYTHDADYCMALKPGCLVIATDEFSKGQTFELTMSVRAVHEAYDINPEITCLTALDSAAIIEYNQCNYRLPFYYPSYKWREVKITGTFDHNGNYIGVDIVNYSFDNEYYIDDICLKIDDKIVVTSNCSSNEDGTFAWTNDMNVFDTPIRFIDKEYALPDADFARGVNFKPDNEPALGDIVYQENDIMIEAGCAYTTNPFAVISRRNYSVIMEIRGDEAARVDVYCGSDTWWYVQCDTQWRTVQFTFIYHNGDYDGFRLTFYEPDEYSNVYIRSLKVVYEGDD